MRNPPAPTLPAETTCAVHGESCPEEEVIAYWHRERIYYFCSEECLEEFLANPPEDERR